MPVFQGQFISIVFIGRHNPRILNHDFLVRNQVLPADTEPFASRLARQDGQPFDEFVSVPVFTTIRYGPISILVDENRYQIRDDRFRSPALSPIVGITKKYFGDLLRYTPLQAGGVNLNGLVTFENDEDEKAFDAKTGLDRAAGAALLGASDVKGSITLTALGDDATTEVRVSKPRDGASRAELNFNYEFRYTDIDSFLRRLDDTAPIYQRFCSLVSRLGMECPK